jgi:hypothetical protein
MSRSWPYGHIGPILLSVVAQALLCNLLCAGFFFPLFRRCRWWLAVESPGFWELDSMLRPIAGVELLKKVFTSRARWILLTSSSMLPPNVLSFEALLLLNLVILKTSCNNLIFHFNHSFVYFVCVFVHSHFIKNPPIDLKATDPSFLRLSQYPWVVLFVSHG